MMRLESVTAEPASAVAVIIPKEGPRTVVCGAMGNDDAMRRGCQHAGHQRHRILTISLNPRHATERCRLTLTYVCAHLGSAACPASSLPAGRLTQTVHLTVLEPARSLLMRHGTFSSSQAWMPESVSDPWHRAPAFFGSDADKAVGGDRAVGGAALADEPRIYMDGLSDEAGAAAPLAMAVKMLGAPVSSEVRQLEAYVHRTLWCPPGENRSRFIQGPDYSVRASMAYWSDELQARPEAARKAAPALVDACLKCWASCPKKSDCCNW